MHGLPRYPRLAFASVFFCCAAHLAVRAEQRVPTLSDAEVEQLRELAPEPPDRVMAFAGFLSQRADEVDKLTVGKRKPGREEDLHDLMQQMAAILDDLDDNLDEYSKRHSDIRRVLPKLVAATERWRTALLSPPENPEYSVQRKLAMESLNEVHEAATQMIAEQSAWFKAHPPAPTPGRNGAA